LANRRAVLLRQTYTLSVTHLQYIENLHHMSMRRFTDDRRDVAVVRKQDVALYAREHPKELFTGRAINCPRKLCLGVVTEQNHLNQTADVNRDFRESPMCDAPLSNGFSQSADAQPEQDGGYRIRGQ